MSVYALIPGKVGARISESKQEFNAGDPGNILVNAGSLRARGATMALVAVALTRLTGRPVVDETGLTGHYDFILEYDQSTVSVDIPSREGHDSPAGTSIFDAVQKTGLQLQGRKGPIEMLIIDQLEKPDSN